MKSWKSVVLTSAVAFPLVAMAAPVVWLAFAERLGRDVICNLRNVPGGVSDPKPANQDQRFTLYLRCEAKGGKDEFVKQSCCEHVSQNDAKNIGICPDNPRDIVVPIRDAFKAAFTC